MMTVMHLCYHGCLCCRILYQIKCIFMLIYITHRIIFSGFHWIKVITWYRADDGSQTISAIRFGIRRLILFRRNEGQVTSKRSSSTSNRSWKTNETFSQEPVTEKWKSWLTIPHWQTRRNTQFMQVLSTCVCLYYFIIEDDTKVCGTNTLISTTPQSIADANGP